VVCWLQQAAWLENVCTSICLISIFLSIIVGEWLCDVCVSCDRFEQLRKAVQCHISLCVVSKEIKEAPVKGEGAVL
jgi:hypothetical protein